MKIAVLISGGVDSAVTVELLHRQGHDLHLFYIKIGNDNGEGDCTAEEDIEMCTIIAKKYGLPFKVVSLHEEYWNSVMQYTLNTVASGLTPHPDIMCNKIIKFGYFEERWGKEFDRTATGHYASIKEIEGRYFLSTAKDPVKDQTDFLAQISYSQLKHILFPLGHLTKTEVRELARQIDLPNARRKDSQGICFLGKINYADFLERHLGTRTGPIVEIETGRKIGTHKGYWFYTIGQRKGLGLSGGPWFVVKKNTRDNVVFVSGGYDTNLQYGKEINIEEIQWISGNPFDRNDRIMSKLFNIEGQSIDISFKTRHSPDFLAGKLFINNDNGYLLKSENNVQGIAPGQFAIIYSSDHSICLGSGMISIPQKSGSKKKSTVDHE